MTTALKKAFGHCRDSWSEAKDGKSYQLASRSSTLYVWDHSKLIMHEFHNESGACTLVFDAALGMPVPHSLPQPPQSIISRMEPELRLSMIRVTKDVAEPTDPTYICISTKGGVIGNKIPCLTGMDFVAPEHVEFRFLKERFELRDLDSGFGSFVDDRELDSEWVSISNPAGIIYLGKDCSLRYTVGSRTVVGVEPDGAAPETRPEYVDRAHVHVAGKRPKSDRVRDYQIGLDNTNTRQQADSENELDMFEAGMRADGSFAGGTGSARAGIGHETASSSLGTKRPLTYAEQSRSKAQSRYSALN